MAWIRDSIFWAYSALAVIWKGLTKVDSISLQMVSVHAMAWFRVGLFVIYTSIVVIWNGLSRADRISTDIIYAHVFWKWHIIRVGSIFQDDLGLLC